MNVTVISFVWPIDFEVDKHSISNSRNKIYNREMC